MPRPIIESLPTIIEAIALGNTEFNQIYMKTQLDKTKLSVYLRNLIKLGIVEREFSALSRQKEHANKNNGEYHLTDSFFRFGYAFAYNNFSELEDGAIDRIWMKYIAANLHNFASKAFENIRTGFSLQKDFKTIYYFIRCHFL